MAKYPSDAKDPYVDPASGVLRNRLGIIDQAELDRVEATFAAVRSYELAITPVCGEFDLAHLQQIHRRLFGDVYEWAGQLRTVDISKGTTRFANHEQIASYAPQITRPLARDQRLQGLSLEAFSERAGHYLGELNVLHPFREGNGRSIREFIGQLARDAGYGIDWQGIRREEMTQASIAAYQGDSSQMASLIRAGLRDIDREYAQDLARAVGGDRSQIMIANPGQTYEGTIIGATERYIVQEQRGRAGEVVLHSRRALVNAQVAVPGQAVEIRYPHGGAGLVERSIDGRANENVLQRENTRELDR
ncbi:Fic/DOC family protein [Achromobacter sp. SLBN-14]|uniref:Fic/DOC family protein n=1 Tax=Achromobacter sp. SLBN-14 TaxID=2768442 RepID=UPI001150331E|nr:Fic/DOC family protein [Achromobacter sp. SLBN-14]TQJ94708.1 fido (protein-threonine AMPylation protein) [Achromobacter sp. SLBN-14]